MVCFSLCLIGDSILLPETVVFSYLRLCALAKREKVIVNRPTNRKSEYSCFWKEPSKEQLHTKISPEVMKSVPSESNDHGPSYTLERDIFTVSVSVTIAMV